MGRPSKPHFHAPTGRWRFRFRKQEYTTLTQAAAWTKLADLERESGQGAREAKPRNIANLITAWAQRAQPGEHAKEMAEEFTRWAGSKLIEDLEDDILLEYARHLQTRKILAPNAADDQVGVSASTLRKKVFYARAALKYGHSRKWLERVPAAPKMGVPVPAPKALTDDQVAGILEKCDAPEDPARRRDGKRRRKPGPRGGHRRRKRPVKAAQPRFPYRPVGRLIRFCLETGSRPSEARTLKWAAVDLERRVVIITSHKTASRTGKLRILPLSDAAVAILETCPRDVANVFPSGLGREYTREGLSAVCRRLGFSPYQLRHTWCQRASDLGVPEEVITELMGHGSAAMIRMYRTLSDSRLRAGVQTAGGLSRIQRRVRPGRKTAEKSSAAPKGSRARQRHRA